MIPNVSNMGQMPINGGYATSGNGDTNFSSDGNKFGGLNYNKGVNPTHLMIGAVVCIGVYLYVTRKAK
jgi:hypothetical protein